MRSWAAIISSVPILVSTVETNRNTRITEFGSTVLFLGRRAKVGELAGTED